MLLDLELQILGWIAQHLRCGVLDAAVPLITYLGEAGAVWILLALVLLCVPKTRKLGLAVAAALVLDLLLCNIILKPLVARPRPYTYLEVMPELLVPRPRDWSFPSGHTAASFASGFALLFSGSGKRFWVPAMVLAAVIAATRLYLFVHFPTDVLGGILVGFLCGFLGAFLVKKMRNPFKIREK